MDGNICGINHLDRDVLLPPRKRLLAGLKKQNLEGFSRTAVPGNLGTHVNKLLNSDLNDPILSPEELVEASRSAAIAAAKVAQAARALAEEKASVATKSVAAAKSALELVASMSEEAATKERCLIKHKPKKQVPVHLLYMNHHQPPVVNYRKDKELARRLHRSINSSPRILRNSSVSDFRSLKQKKPKIMLANDENRVPGGEKILESSSRSTCSENTTSEEMDSEGFTQEAPTARVDEKVSKVSQANRLEMNGREAGSSHSTEKIREVVEGTSPSGRKRGRIKLKKLPLSVCTYRDQASLTV